MVKAVRSLALRCTKITNKFACFASLVFSLVKRASPDYKTGEQRADNGRGVQTELFGHHPCNTDGMVDVRLAAFAPHVFVCFEGNVKGFADRLSVFPRFAVHGRPKQSPVPAEDFLLFCFEINGGCGHEANFGQIRGKSTLRISLTCGHV